MKLFEDRSWTSVETEDSVVITIVRSRRLVSSLIGPTTAAFGLCEAYLLRSWYWLAFGLMAVASIIADRLHGNTTQLTVTEKEIVVRGNVGKIFSDTIRVEVKGLRSLSYDAGGEDDESGLYALHARGPTCLISGLNEKQSNEIALIVYKRFPDLESGDTDVASLLFGPRHDLISLGLSNNK